ncbi:hypothetical protein ON010_g12023 [Phytophthora cinnamomi]|nr:hypothetical protein ON010_g12023 [Phytophthora cinnamomi]
MSYRLDKEGRQQGHQRRTTWNLGPASSPVEATSGDIWDSVYTVVAMIMGCHEFPLGSWSYSQLDKILDITMELLLNPALSGSTISVAQLLHELLPDVSLAYESATGAGSSASSQIDDRPTTAAPNTSSFFDMTAVDDDVENAADEVVLVLALQSNGNNCPVNAENTVPVNRSQQPQLGHAGLALEQTSEIGPIANPAPLTVPARMETETPADVEILDLVWMRKPHLLPYLLECRQMSVTGAKRSADEWEEKWLTKRSKFSFTPTPEQHRVHAIVTSDAYKGKSPASYMDSMVSYADLLLWAYPGVAMRALKRQRENFVNMSDISVSTKFLPVPDPASWDDILAGATGLQQYCAVMCDAVTQQLAITRYNFLGALKSRKRWPQDMPLRLVLWIESQLEQQARATWTSAHNPTRKDGGNDAVVPVIRLARMIAPTDHANSALATIKPGRFRRASQSRVKMGRNVYHESTCLAERIRSSPPKDMPMPDQDPQQAAEDLPSPDPSTGPGEVPTDQDPTLYAQGAEDPVGVGQADQPIVLSESNQGGNHPDLQIWHMVLRDRTRIRLVYTHQVMTKWERAWVYTAE